MAGESQNNNELVDFDPFMGPSIELTVPATEPQREILHTALIDQEASIAFNETIRIDFHSRINEEVLKKSIGILVSRHESLRGSFNQDGSLFVISKDQELDFVSAELNKHTESLSEIENVEVTTPFSLFTGPLFRVRLYNVTTKSILFLS